MALEAGTAVWLFFFFWLEATVLKYALGNQVLLYLFSILGLVVAGFALYAHVIISLVSRILVDMVVPGEGGGADQPRFGPVESLERSEDFEGALKEYLVLARIYPRNFEVLSRTARVSEILGQTEEAVAWYLRARKRAADSREALAAVNRLCTLFDGDLDRPDDADQQLAWFMTNYPESPDVDIVRDRLERRAYKSESSISSELSALDLNPLESGSGAGAEVPAMPGLGGAMLPDVARLFPDRLSLDSLEQVAVSGALATGLAGQKPAPKGKPAEPAQASGGASNGGQRRAPTLQALDEPGAPPLSPADKAKAPKSSIGLEAMGKDESKRDKR